MGPRSSQVDGLKPPLPYVRGTQLKIRRHMPPLPLGSDYTEPQARQMLLADCYESYMDQYKTASKLCLAHPPLETPPHPKQTVHSLTIVDQVACGDTRGPQIVTCRINRQEVVQIAKIFDPLYYNFDDGFDPTYSADEHSSVEAAAYYVIRNKGLDGKFTPKFYGSFTFDMPFLDGQYRPVRMVLIEHIPHPTIKHLIDTGAVEAISSELRMRGLAKAAEAKMWLEYNGVIQNDFYPRNVLINHQRPGEIDVIIIDFSHARVRDMPNSRWKSFPPGHAYHKARPRSPVDAFSFSWGEFTQWVPAELRDRHNRVAWLMSQWGDTAEFEPPRRIPQVEPIAENDDV